MTLTKQSRTPLFTTLLVSALAGLSLAACDLPNKDIGKETNGDDDAGVCEDGDTKPADDGCNTCVCDENGDWACTEIACADEDTDGGDDSGMCEPGDGMPAPDGCNTCTCEDDGQWACTEIACDDGDDDGEVCEPDTTMPAPDGCNTCTCNEDGLWECTEIACSMLPLCPDDFSTDPFEVTDATIEGDSLAVTVAYSGGCAEHTFALCWDGEWLESNPVQTGLRIAHDDGGDDCDAYPSEEVEFDLLPMQAAYQQAYGDGSATLFINLESFDGDLAYSF